MKRQRIDESKYNNTNNVQLKHFNNINDDITTSINSTQDKHLEIEQVLHQIQQLQQQHQQQQLLTIDDNRTQELLILLWKLREFGLSSIGYCNDTIRQKVYPILILGLNYDQLLQQEERSVGETICDDDYYFTSNTSNHQNDSLLTTRYGAGNVKSHELEHYNHHHHQDYEQIKLDVVRNAWEHLKIVQSPNTFDTDEYELGVEERKKLLTSFIDLTLQTPRRNSNCNQQEQLYSNVWVNNKQITEESTLQQHQQQQRQQQHTLRYYQGYHDVASIILSIMMATTTPTLSNESDITVSDNEATSTGTTAVTPNTIGPISSSSLQDAAVRTITKATTNQTLLSQLLLHRLSTTHLQDYMTDSFTRLQTIMNLSLRPLLWKLDIELYNHLFLYSHEDDSTEQQSFLFSISWILTWFCHDLLKPKQQQQYSSSSDQQQDVPIDIVKRLFDFFIVSHPTMTLYVTIAMMLHPTNRQYLIGCCDPTDYSNIHSIMSQMPYNLTLNSNKNNEDGHDQQHIDSNEEVSHHSLGNNNNYWQVFPLVDDAASDTSESDDDYQVLMMDDYMPTVCINNNNDQMKTMTPSHRDDENDIDFATSTGGTMLHDEYTKTAFHSHCGRRFCNTVPIDEIIQLSISFMNTIPPYKLVDLAQEHYGSDCPNVQDWLQVLPTITTTFQPLDITASFVTNSCVSELQQPLQRDALLFSETTSLVHSTIQDCSKPYDVALLTTNMLKKIVDDNSTAVAIIAAGYGVCPPKENRKRRKWYFRMFSALPIPKKTKKRIIMVTSMMLLLILAYFFLVQPVFVKKNKVHDHIPIVVILSSVPEVEVQEQTVQNVTVILTEDLNQNTLVNDKQEGYQHDENITITDARKMSSLQATSNSNKKIYNWSSDEMSPYTTDFGGEIPHVETVMMNQTPHELPVARENLFSIESSHVTNSNDHYGCIVAGLPSQLLCLVDGSQLCRPIRSDGIVNLLDLSIDDVVSYTPCQQEPEPRDIQVRPFNSKNVQLASTNGTSLRCPIEFASCGNYDSSLLICNLNRSSTNEVKSERNDKRGNSRYGSELCVKADRVSSTLLQVVVPIVPDNKNSDSTSWKQNQHSFDTSSHICGCCDGFDPNIDSAGVCIDYSSRTITTMLSNTQTTNRWLERKDCCHPCRPQVPIEYRPCCCFHNNHSWNNRTKLYDVSVNNITNSAENCFSDDTMFGYENCKTSML